MYSNNPAFKLEVEHNGVRIFTPIQGTEVYSTQRYIEAMNQNIFSQSGATRDVLETVMNEILQRCNDDKNKSIRTEIGALVQSIIYRLAHPVDQHCAVRMGAILSFMEEDVQVSKAIADPADESKTIIVSNEPPIIISEPQEKAEYLWIDKKMQLAFSDSKMYDFFLTWGIVNTPAYNERLDILKDSEYFVKRMEAITSLNPTNPYKK